MTSGYVALALLGACSFSGHGQPDVDAGKLDGSTDGNAAIDAPPDAPPDAPRPWWDPAYPFRMQISVANAAALPAGYQLSVDIDLDVAPCASQQASRIVVDHTTELDRVIEPSPTAGAERIWFKTDAALPMNAVPTSYWLYCGAAAPAPAPANADMVFDLVDSFDGTLAAKWSPHNAASVTGGSLQLDSGESVVSMLTFGPGQTMEWSMRASATNGQFWGGLQSGTATVYTAPWLVWIARQANALHGEVLPDGGTEPGSNVVGPDHTITAIPIAYAIEYQQDHAYFRFENGVEQDLPGTVSPPLRARFENYSGNAATLVDWARVRKAVRPAPVASLGTAEPY